jgi:hypothetical protein
LGKPANGSPGLELQLSTSCNPRILQIPGILRQHFFVLRKIAVCTVTA